MQKESLEALTQLASEAAHAAGGLIMANFAAEHPVSANEAHDIKIELDRRVQDLLEHILLSRLPHYSVLGEEGIHGSENSENQWILDPIDGTVNYFYGLPHFCVSIALRRTGKMALGVVYDPFRKELWTAYRGGPALLNGRPIRVSQRSQLSEAILTVGFAKTEDSIQHGLPIFSRLVRQAKKCRMMGSAALDTAYVASGRLDAYIEGHISLWDIAAGIVLVEVAGGKVRLEPLPTHTNKYRAVVWNGILDLPIE